MQDMISNPELHLDHTLLLRFKSKDGQQYCINVELNSKEIWIVVNEEVTDELGHLILTKDEHGQPIQVADGKWPWSDIENCLKKDLVRALEWAKHSVEAEQNPDYQIDE